MKCPECDGVGRIHYGEEWCSACNGTGEVQTNEEWFDGLSTEEKAELLYRVHYGGIGIGLTKEEIRKWLKEVHKE